MRKRHQTFALAVVTVALSGSGCEQDTRGHVDGQNPPTISLSGSGKIYFLRVMEEPVEKAFWEKGEGGIWQIEPQGNTKDLNVSQYPAIKYGVVPPGFIQRAPKDGKGPPPLEEGKTYNVWAPTYNANGGGVRFLIKEGKSVELQ